MIRHAELLLSMFARAMACSAALLSGGSVLAAPPDDATYLSTLEARAAKWRDALPQGTGPFRVARGVDPGLSDHTIFRPEDLKRAGRLPIIAWANGGCRDSSLEFAGYLSEIASHGYFIVAVGRDDVPFKLMTDNSPPSIEGRPVQRVGAEALTSAVTWAVAQDADPRSPYHGHLDTRHIAYVGQSCGGIQALSASADPRATTTLVLNSGYFRSPISTGFIKFPPQVRWTDLRAPIGIFTGGETDVAYQNAIWSYDDAVAAGIPTFIATYPPVGHSGAYAEPDPTWARATRAWLDWQLKGDANAKTWFVGSRCRLCVDPAWKDVASRGLR